MFCFIPAICGVECWSRRKSGPKFDLFCAPNFASIFDVRCVHRPNSTQNLNKTRQNSEYVRNDSEVSQAKQFEGKFLWGIYKSTPLPTYWPSLVEILWLVFHLCWQNNKNQGQIFPKLLQETVSPSSPLTCGKNLVGLVSVAFVLEARPCKNMQNFHTVGHDAPTNLSRFYVNEFLWKLEYIYTYGRAVMLHTIICANAVMTTKPRYDYVTVMALYIATYQISCYRRRIALYPYHDNYPSKRIHIPH